MLFFNTVVCHSSEIFLVRWKRAKEGHSPPPPPPATPNNKTIQKHSDFSKASHENIQNMIKIIIFFRKIILVPALRIDRKRINWGQHFNVVKHLKLCNLERCKLENI